MKLAEYKSQSKALKDHLKKRIKKHEIDVQHKFGYKEKLAHKEVIKELKTIQEMFK